MKQAGIALMLMFGGLTLTLVLVACKVGPDKQTEFNPVIPLGLDETLVFIPSDNPLTVEKVALGKQLYFDARLSRDNTVSCATCHSPRFGFTDGQPVFTGIQGQKGGRSAPKEVFGAEDFTIEHVGKAIAAYERTIVSGNSPFDRFQAGDSAALSPAAQRGLELFQGEAEYAVCHSGANFTDERYHNLGVGMDQLDPDPGRFAVTQREEDMGAFKTPGLRDTALTAPYFHDGSAQTLEQVVEYYNRGGTENSNLSPTLLDVYRMLVDAEYR